MCPNNTRKAAEEEEPKKKPRGKKAQAEEPAAPAVKCDYSRPLPKPGAVA
jgi:hypothetical protein